MEPNFDPCVACLLDAPGVNGTDFDPCVACLLDALVKLDSGALLVNVTAEIESRANSKILLYH